MRKIFLDQCFSVRGETCSMYKIMYGEIGIKHSDYVPDLKDYQRTSFLISYSI